MSREHSKEFKQKIQSFSVANIFEEKGSPGGDSLQKFDLKSLEVED